MHSFIVKINFKGGLISPGDLLQILNLVKKTGIGYVSFGLRQQCLIEVSDEEFYPLTVGLNQLKVPYEVDGELYPNIISSYPAEEIFINKTWLSEGVYKDIFDCFDYQPSLKINIADHKQSFTPVITGNINWVASDHPHYWHLILRFPKTNILYNWKELVYTNDIAAVSKKIEKVMKTSPADYYENNAANGDFLFDKVTKGESFTVQPVDVPLKLPAFSLPYYEGFNKYHDKYWLGIYRRDEKFSVNFLREICQICLTTKIGHFCSTPWKSLIIKGILEKDRPYWNAVLGKYQINVRHAANELNFQVEDQFKDGLNLKQYLVKHLNRDDMRTFGICFGIKTRKKSEIFSSILIRKKYLISFAGFELFALYDILFSKNFNPNERTGIVFSKNNLKSILPEQLRMAIVAYYKHQAETLAGVPVAEPAKPVEKKVKKDKFLYQCPGCYSVYDAQWGEPDNGIEPGTAFSRLPADYQCPTCETEKQKFVIKPESEIYQEIEH